ncbi:MAG: hypothetical protein IJE48_09425 [Clostridia bacterium]|nr:hypothetical protein [Clostridia bacterium]
MLSILAILSDIPFWFAEIISKVTGTDTSVFLDSVSNLYSEIMEALNFLA